jgi:cytoplasmic FMR1 interacting protein
MLFSIWTCLQQVVRCNYTSLERKALVELTSYVKGVGTMMERVDTVVADSIWEVLHAQVQEFVQNKLAIMLRTTFKKKKDLSRYIIAPSTGKYSCLS